MKRITENDCIAEIKRVYRECGTITSNLFQKHGKIALTTVYKKCGSWNGALKTAGLYKEKTCDDIKNGIIQAMREMHEREKKLASNIMALSTIRLTVCMLRTKKFWHCGNNSML